MQLPAMICKICWGFMRQYKFCIQSMLKFLEMERQERKASEEGCWECHIKYIGQTASAIFSVCNKLIRVR